MRGRFFQRMNPSVDWKMAFGSNNTETLFLVWSRLCRYLCCTLFWCGVKLIEITPGLFFFLQIKRNFPKAAAVLLYLIMSNAAALNVSNRRSIMINNHPCKIAQQLILQFSHCLLVVWFAFFLTLPQGRNPSSASVSAQWPWLLWWLTGAAHR